MSWIDDIISPETRRWEEFYRNRFQHDKVVRSTHGVNCTGGCSWNIAVKEGIVTWETQALDYPIIDPRIPPYEPRGCQRGISFSWYLYSPIRVKYPYMRGALIDLWREARRRYDDPVEAWGYLQANPEARSRYHRARGKGGFRRVSWDEALELIAAANISTIKKHGPDRIAGFSPIPAMSMLSYASGARFLQLMGGVNLSFYDWYCDLPSASPETWGEQTDVAESADWYHSKFTAIMGANLNMTRTPDCHFMVESRHNGTKVVVFSPDFSQVSKFGDQWIAINPGQDGAFWMAANHVILKEFHHEKATPYFIDYQKKYTDGPFLVHLDPEGDHFVPGPFVRAAEISRYKTEENGTWKFLVLDEKSKQIVMPKGSVGHRWEKSQGRWNLEWKDGADDKPFEPLLTLINDSEKTLKVGIPEFGTNKNFLRAVPVRYLDTEKGKVPFTTVYDLLMAQYGVDRDLGGDYPKGYDDREHGYTPAWQENFTGITRETVIQFAREWATTAMKTEGKCSVIIGAGINHWYHANLMYRAAINALVFCGCIGKNGGGLNHYVGQEKLAPMPAWSAIAFARDWMTGCRLQNAPNWHYMHSDQWRYEREYQHICASPGKHPLTKGHAADLTAQAVRCGWLPFYPQFNKSPLAMVEEAVKNGAKSDDDIKKQILNQILEKKVTPCVEDIDAPESFPRVWYIWRGNALLSSAKGHEYFLDHYLGTHTNKIAREAAQGKVKEVKWHETAPTGKMDLVVDLNFRMDTSALYSDIVLPAASWYEKTDLNSTDMHSFIHPLSSAIAPVWESKPDWDIFREITKKTSELARRHFPTPVKDFIAVPLQHDTVDEISQPTIKDWAKGECEPVPGKTMYKLAVVERDYANLYNQFVSLGPKIRENGLGAHGVSYDVADFYDEMIANSPTQQWGGKIYPSVKKDMEAANAILRLSSETNGELAWRAYKTMEKRTGLRLTDIAENTRAVRTTFKDLLAAPKRLLSSPVWSGLMNGARTFSAFTYNVDRMVPWRTLTGRQSLYLDQEGYRAFGEELPTYKPRPCVEVYGDLDVTGEQKSDRPAVQLNYLTPHGKWHIHSTFGDTLRMLSLSRGTEPFWISEKDAARINIKDNDWVEVYNDNGVVTTRACVSARIPEGMCFIYHSPERTYMGVKSELRNNRRGGGHNSLTRVHLKPNLFMGGYGQFTYHFNYWGPIGCNRDTHIMVRKLNKVEW